MSARDWSTIGMGSSLPRWTRWAIPPLLVPLAAMIWIGTHWDRIPLRYATHFGSNGRPDGWTTRTPLHVFGIPIFAEGLTAILIGLALAIWYGSRRPARSSPMVKIPLAVAYLMGLVFSAVGLMPVVEIPVWPLAVMTPLLVLGLIVYVVRAQSEDADTSDNTPDQCWSMGGIYNNPKDPALFVRARAGYGYTFNMANRWSYGILIGLLGGIGLLVGFLIWSMQ